MIILPEKWSLSEQQDIVIGNLIDNAGNYITAEAFCDAIYAEDIGEDPAPAKLRVLIQRCRAIVEDISKDQVKVKGRRNSGWKMTYQHGQDMLRIIDRTSRLE